MAVFTNSTGLAIPDRDSGGGFHPVNQSLVVSGLSGTVTNLTVSVTVSDNFMNDLEFMLVAPDGTHNLLFFSDAGGGSGVANTVTLVFSDAASGAVPRNPVPFNSGTYLPTDYSDSASDTNNESATNFGAGALTVTHPNPTGDATLLSTFGGLTANGTWKLYALDDANQDTGTITTWSLDITAATNPPIITNLSGDSVTFSEGGSATLLDAGANATITDTDSTDFNGGSVTVSITANKVAGEDVLGIATTGTVTLSAGVTTGSHVSVSGADIGTITSGGSSGADLVISLNANSTPSNVTSLLHALTYSNSNTADPSASTRTVAVTVADGDGGTSAASNVSVNITAQNDAPVVTTSAGTNAFTEGSNVSSTPVIVDSGITVADADNLTLSSATVSITGNFHSGEDVLAFINNNGATFGNIQANGYIDGVLSLSSSGGSATTTQWQHALAAVTYTNTSDTPSTDTRTLTFQVNDGAGLTFSAAAPHTVGNTPAGVAAADLDGNGIPDLIVANVFSNNVSVLLGQGGGAFSPAVDFGAGTDPEWIAFGDFNGDNKIDLAVADYTGSVVSVLLGNGSGSFGAATTFASGTGSTWIGTQDLDGDGKLDLVTADTGSNGISVLLGNGDGTFGAPVHYQTGGNPLFAAFGNLNPGDAADIVVVDSANSKLSILLGNGDGSFTESSDVSVGVSSPRAVAIADFNGDGKADLATADLGDQVSILLGGGDGTFAAPATINVDGGGLLGIAAGDVNRDGNIDLTVSGNGSSALYVLLGNGNGTFSGPISVASAGSTPYAVLLHDMNQDGALDLITTNQGSGSVAVAFTSTGWSNLATKDISVASVNDAPVMTNLGPPTSKSEYQAIILDDDVTVSDAELDSLNSGNGDYAGASLVIQRSGGADTLDGFYVNTGSSFTTSNNLLQFGGLTFGTQTYSAGQLTVNFTSSGTTATKALVNDVLQHIVYNHDSHNPPSSVTLEFAFHDGNSGTQGSGGDGVTAQNLTVNITPVNDKPVLDIDVNDDHTTASAYQALYIPAGSAVAVTDSDVSLIDVDTTNMTTATITIANAKPNDQLTLSGALPGTITQGGTATSMVLTGPASKADFIAALKLVQFSNTLSNPDTTTRDITVVVNDGTDPSDAVHASIVINSPPTTPLDNDGVAGSSVTEGAPVDTPVGLTAFSTDPEAAGAITYSLITNPGGFFKIDSGTGVVSVSSAGATGIDFESSGGSYGITVKATDAAGAFSSQNFTISVNNVVPTQPTDSDTPTGGTVQEGAANGTTVGITASSTDVNGGTVIYAITAGNADGAFTIGLNSGIVTVADTSKLDAETAPSRLITVQGSDGTLPSITRDFSISIADVDEFDVTAPVDTNTTTADAVNENVAVGTGVGIRANAADADGSNNTVSYSLFNNGGGLFAIDSASGIVKTAAAIDREATGASVGIVVRAASTDGSTADTPFTIAIGDLNDVAPLFASGTTGSEAENTAATNVVYDANASDGDVSPAFKNITYSLTTGGDNALFSIDSSTGEVRFLAPPNFEAPSDAGANNVYDIVVHANDGVNDTTQNVAISVTGVNEAPSSVGHNYTLNKDAPLTVAAAEGLLNGASDPEHDPLAALLVSNPAHGTLSVNADGSFTYEAANTFFGEDSFSFKANDGALDSNVSTIKINVARETSSETTTNPGGGSSTTYHDAKGDKPWSSQSHNFDSNGHETSATVSYDDGSLQGATFDADNNQPWKSQSSVTNAQGQVTNMGVFYDDGTQQVAIFDAGDNQPWLSQHAVYDALGRQTTLGVIYDDGSQQTAIFDAANDQLWSSQNMVYDVHGHLTNVGVIYDDLHTETAVYDVHSDQPWTSQSAVYDPSGSLIAASVRYDDGHVENWHI